MRTSCVPGPEPDGGLAQQVGQYRKGQGGIPTPTEAWVSWIHLADEARLYLFALEDDRVTGPLNSTAPGPVTRVVPGLLLKLMMGKVAEIFMYGKPVVPRKAEALGFEFEYPTLEAALADLVPQIN